jgi:hypothetical protein
MQLCTELLNTTFRHTRLLKILNKNGLVSIFCISHSSLPRSHAGIGMAFAKRLYGYGHGANRLRSFQAPQNLQTLKEEQYDA